MVIDTKKVVLGEKVLFRNDRRRDFKFMHPEIDVAAQYTIAKAFDDSYYDHADCFDAGAEHECEKERCGNLREQQLVALVELPGLGYLGSEWFNLPQTTSENSS